MNRSKTFALGLALSLLAGACGYSEEEMQAERDKITALQASLDKLSADNKAYQDKISQVSMQNQAMVEQLRKLGISVEDQKRSLEEQNKALEELRAKERQAQQRLATFRNMVERFQKMIESGQLRVLLGAVLRVVEGTAACVLHELRVVLDRIIHRVDPGGVAAGADDQRQHP